MGTRKIICMGSLFFLSVAIPYERLTSIRGGCSRTILNPAKRNAIAVKNEMRFSLQKRNVLQKSRLQSFRLSYPVEIQVSFKRLLKTI